MIPNRVPTRYASRGALLVFEGPRWLGSVLLLALLAPWLYLLQGAEPWSEHRGREPSLRLKPVAAAHSDHASESKGSWGKLVTQSIVIAPPLEFVDAMTTGRVDTDWHFPGVSGGELPEYLHRLSLRLA